MPDKQNSKTRDELIPLHVLHIVLNLEIGGAQTVVRTVVEYLALGGVVPVVCTFRDGPLRQEIERLGIQVEVLPPRRYGIVAFPLFIADMFRIWRSLARLVKQHKINVIQTHLLRSLDFLVLLLRYTNGVRVILWTVHSANFLLMVAHLSRHKWLLKPKRYAHRQLYRLVSGLVSGFIAVSDQVKMAAVENIGPIQDKVLVICNGVDVRRYGRAVDKACIRNQLGLGAQAYLIAMVGTFRAVKGHRYLIEAMAAIVPQHPEVHVLFIGDGELRIDLQTSVERLGLNNHIHFLGSRHDVPELLAASDLFVLPSLWEGLSMALLEAMATGLPIVASEVSGTVQTIIPGQTGLLVPPGDSEQLAQAIQDVLSNPLHAQEMGQAARQRVETEFSAQRQADQYLALYRRLLLGKSLQ